MEIRVAELDDAEAVAAFQVRAWEQTYRGLVPDTFLDAPSSQDRRARWAGRIRRGERRVLLASARDVVLGVSSTARTSEPGLPAMELCTLYVDAAAQGTGMSDQLLDAALGRAAAHLLVFSVNERAKRFYARHGFSRRGEPRTDPGTGLDEERWVRLVSRAV
ncbi:GNAT family N-acetyltransferase [Curtobacterium sp. C1]|uniref:GNAT family N-acetyltransferase n=1 Tax=Curtobacterium TaxID=2034 RepID=UPI000E0C2A2C|nr:MULTISPECIES: GNAT family N-acetyltransferase [Curtobacterium]MDK8172346.1 GNAT family N-acetyltransferase [Curtobacterium citreum]QKS13371.1 GNAT family N-acetyltransferase [Curtobacterium sp. csp3]QKS18743.1 GNAT family N-acetyltransferase [Curtobacterium sp. Csp1]RDH95247.1 L-amino acid N-acyltransferase YncA [Curtobacterium sp. AG1037]UFU13545.1 GNAT family N-acetyltransferase [Curtobacterium sp. C1]